MVRIFFLFGFCYIAVIDDLNAVIDENLILITD